MACINAIYWRSNILDWDDNRNRRNNNNNFNDDNGDGSDKVNVVEDWIMNEDNDSGYDKFDKVGSFDKDMLSIIDISKREIKSYRPPTVGKTPT